jgi:hypothetical protein
MGGGKIHHRVQSSLARAAENLRTEATTATIRRATAEIRAALVERNAEHVPEVYVLVTEDQAADLAAGYVPTSVRAMCRTMLDWQDEDRRRADRPVRPPRGKKARS